MEEIDNKQILFLFPGPRYNLKSHFSQRMENLSSDFGGVVLTSCNEPLESAFGKFKVYARGEKNFRSIMSSFRMFKRAKQVIRDKDSQNEKINLIVTYDPLTTGLIGVLLAKMYSIKLLVELNGDYGAPETYADIPSRWKRFYVLSRNKFVASLVLFFADGAKLLYKKQLDNFSPRFIPPVVNAYANNVDISTFHPGEQKKEILFVGFPFRLKGLDLLIDAFKKISMTKPDWTLKIIGWYPDPKELNEAIGGHSKITYIPPIDRDAMQEYMSSASIFVLPSRSEAMGRVLLEAAACGVARIGSTAGGIPSVIDDGVNGLLFKKGSLRDLESKLILLIDNESLREKLGVKA
jgi:glycosyltransferase involved in cell wall biosynthesis